MTIKVALTPAAARWTPCCCRADNAAVVAEVTRAVVVAVAPRKVTLGGLLVTPVSTVSRALASPALLCRTWATVTPCSVR